MTTTIKKEFRESVRNHILNCLPGEDSVSVELMALANEFHDYYMSGNWVGKQEAFHQYLCCVPSTLNTHFTNDGVIHFLTEWYASIGKEYDVSRSGDALRQYHWFIFRDIHKLYYDRGLGF